MMHTQAFSPWYSDQFAAIDISTHKQPKQHPSIHTLDFSADGQNFQLHLTKNDKLFSPSYSETHQIWKNGIRQKHMESEPKSIGQIEHCYYHGSVDGYIGEVAMHTCHDGFSGMIRLREYPSKLSVEMTTERVPDLRPFVAETYIMEPAHKHMTSQQLSHHVMRLQSIHSDRSVETHALHIVYKLRDAKEIHSFTSGVVAEVMSASQRHQSSTESSSSDSDIQYHRCGVDHKNVIQSYDIQEHAPHYNDSSLKRIRYQSETKQASIDDGGVPMSSEERAASTQYLGKAAAPANRYLELFIANDYNRYLQRKTQTESNTAAIVNIISANYGNTAFAPSTLQVTLVGQTTFSHGDPWNITLGNCAEADPNEVCVAQLLSTWNAWRRNPENTAPYEFNDAGHLFSGLDFQASVLGYAGVGSMCTTSTSGGINQMTVTDVDHFNAAIATHEIGHNLGMQHDSTNGNTCPASGYIMNAIVQPGQGPDTFSTCSMNYYSTWTNQGNGVCLNNIPTTKYGDPICGNGYIEVGETCDCGSYGLGIDNTNVNPDFCQITGRDPCCDALSCQLIEEAECSLKDSCCTSSCKVRPADDKFICRPADSTTGCDLPETCDGISSSCPFDENVGNGQSCTLSGNNGACFEGDCMSFERTCSNMNDKFNGGPFVPCPIQAKLNEQFNAPYGFCGWLFCTTANDIRIGKESCSQFNFTSVMEIMDDGVPCGSDAQCYKGNCVSSTVTNVRYQWIVTDWEKCSDCNTFQSRNVSCMRVSTGTITEDTYCVAAAKPPIIQQCNDEELLCEQSLSGSISFNVLGRNIEVSSPVVMGTSAALFVFLMVALYWCTSMVSKKPQDASHDTLNNTFKNNKSGKRRSQSNKPNEPASRQSIIDKSKKSQVQSSGFMVV
jgi:hypothetical protein